MAQTVVVLKRAHFFSIDNDIIDVHAKTIGAMGIAIYAVLARYANRKTGECWPAIARIQRTLNIGRSTVKRYLQRLQAAGLISIEERWDQEGDRTSNRYTLLPPDPEAVAHRHAQPETATVHSVPETEGGGFAANPPSVPTAEAGRVTVNPEPPDPQNQHRETTPAAASLGTTARQQTCPHPASEVHRLSDGITICFHCFALLGNDVKREGPCHDTVVAA